MGLTPPGFGRAGLMVGLDAQQRVPTARLDFRALVQPSNADKY